MNTAQVGLAYAAAVEDLLAWLTVERGRSRNTVAAYRADLERLGSRLMDREIDPLAASYTELASYLAELAAEGTQHRDAAPPHRLDPSAVRVPRREGRLSLDPTVDLRPPARAPRRARGPHPR